LYFSHLQLIDSCKIYEMENEIMNAKTPRRNFLGAVATGVAALGISTVAAPLNVTAGEKFITEESLSPEDPDTWFKKIKGKHRVVFDVPKPHEIFPFAWPRVFLATNEKTGSPASDCGVVVVLRHTAIGYAMQDSLWTKYNFGEFFGAEDPATKKPASRNPFWKPAAGAFAIPGIGAIPIGINELQESGVKFCVCDAALTVYSAAVAGKMNLDPATVKAEWVAGVLPGIQIVPSGVWALGRAQENGCAYISAAG
jgi:intracellular sulfur oxidation DsrE/DsrF family protein